MTHIIGVVFFLCYVNYVSVTVFLMLLLLFFLKGGIVVLWVFDGISCVYF